MMMMMMMMKKVDWERDQELLLGSNPLSYPPN